jgi:hypothetical protein
VFFSNLLTLEVDRDYIEGRLNQLPKSLCLDGLKVRLIFVVLHTCCDLPAPGVHRPVADFECFVSLVLDTCSKSNI